MIPKPSSPARFWKFRSNKAASAVPAFISLLLSFILLTAYRFNLDTLSAIDQKKIDEILERWKPVMEAKKKEGSAIRMDFETLYAPLDEEGRAFLDELRSLDPKKEFRFQGGKLDTSTSCGELARLAPQWIEKNGEKQTLDPQVLPRETLEGYEQMMQAMEKDIGKRLLVESGYRSPAYQLYTFLFYLPKHGYSLRETARWIALPGYSEHGAPSTQAIDFINQEGVNGEDDVTEFERLPEYQWLLKNARRFGFELSYPRGKPDITYEPWHWRHANASCAGTEKAG